MPGNVLLEKAFLASHCLNNNELSMCGGRFWDFATHHKLTYPFNYQPENVKYPFFHSKLNCCWIIRGFNKTLSSTPRCLVVVFQVLIPEDSGSNPEPSIYFKLTEFVLVWGPGTIVTLKGACGKTTTTTKHYQITNQAFGIPRYYNLSIFPWLS